MLVLSEAEAVDFVEKILHVVNVREKCVKAKLELLKDIASNFQKNIPFQNLSLMSLHPNERSLPSTEQIRKDYFSRVGGICYSTSTFLCGLITALGFTAVRSAATIPVTGRPSTHAFCLVKDVERSGDKYLLDLGAGFPTFEPIPLHNLPQEYHHAFLQYKFIRKDNGKICRLHRTGKHLGSLPTAVDAEGWQAFYEFDEVELEEEYMISCQRPLYTIPGYGARWILMGIKMSIYPENEAVTLNDYVLKIWKQETNEMVTTDLKDANEFQSAVKKYFPTLHSVDFHRALTNMEMIKK